MWRSSVRRLRAAGDEVRVLTTDYRRPDPEPGIDEDPWIARELRWYWHEHEFPPFGARTARRLERAAELLVRVFPLRLGRCIGVAVGRWRIGTAR